MAINKAINKEIQPGARVAVIDRADVYHGERGTVVRLAGGRIYVAFDPFRTGRFTARQVGLA